MDRETLPANGRSTADLRREALIYGIRVTENTLDHYRREGILPSLGRVGLGRAAGVHGLYPNDAFRTVVAIPYVMHHVGRHLDLAAIGAWGLHGAPVPERTIREYLKNRLTRTIKTYTRRPEQALWYLMYRGVRRAKVFKQSDRKRRLKRLLDTVFPPPGTSPDPAAIHDTLLSVLQRAGTKDLKVPKPSVDTAGQWVHVIPRALSIPGWLDSITKAKAEDFEAVRPLLPRVVDVMLHTRRFIDGVHPSRRSARQNRTLIYTTLLPCALALLIHLKTELPEFFVVVSVGVVGFTMHLTPDRLEAIRDAPFRHRRAARITMRRRGQGPRETESQIKA